ncbi:DUF5085 family protein [Vagococcus sp. BWB3-3]|uniref:DUF5085 family protein n=1 Tax=Vagococcus allomyrinae TaxID=2794353 RepID=A0A940SUP1_9ENTE|nr:DUF5085 family protein [Vagococcus allomyrinae]MBP1044532.1 DUF5085 family protein [Vagococcus allomyrinae]
MIVENKKLAYRNVYMETYSFYPEDIDEALEKYQSKLEEVGLTPVGPFFYEVISDIQDEIMDATFYMPIKESRLPDNFDDEFVRFSSYLRIDQMIMTRVMGDFEKEAQSRYNEMLRYAGDQDLTIVTPFFNVFKSIEDQTYVEIYLGATRIFDTPEEEVFHLLSDIEERRGRKKVPFYKRFFNRRKSDG